MEKYFLQNDPCDIDLWPREPTLDTGHVNTKPNQRLKYNGPMTNSS